MSRFEQCVCGSVTGTASSPSSRPPWIVLMRCKCADVGSRSPCRHKWREAALLCLWGALVFISVSYMRVAATLEYSEPGALTHPLWAGRAFGLESTIVGPVAMRVSRS